MSPYLSSRLSEDDGLREGARLLLIAYGSLGAMLVVLGLYELALWLWSQPAAFWIGCGRIALLILRTVLMAVAFEGLERAGRRMRRVK